MDNGENEFVSHTEIDYEHWDAEQIAEFIENEDIDIGQLYQDDRCKNPMYSYYRPASAFWNGFYRQLRMTGHSREEAIDLMQSKYTRWLFDQKDGEVEKLGAELAKEYCKVDGKLPYNIT